MGLLRCSGTVIRVPGVADELQLSVQSSKSKFEKNLLCFYEVKLKILRVLVKCKNPIYVYENHDIAIAMSPSRADPVLPWLGVFKYLNQCH